MYISGQDITIGVKPNLDTITTFSVTQWIVDDAQLNWALSKMKTATTTLSGPLIENTGLADGDYAFTAQITYNGVTSYEATCDFTYYNVAAGNTNFKPFKVLCSSHVSIDRKAVPNVDIFCEIEVDGSDANALFFESYEWLIYKKEADSTYTQLVIGEANDVFAVLAKNSLEPGISYKLEVKALRSDGSQYVASNEFTMSSKASLGNVIAKSVDGSATLKSFSNLELRFTGFRDMKGIKIYSEPKVADPTKPRRKVKEAKNFVVQTSLPDTTNNNLPCTITDGNYWEIDFNLADYITVEVNTVSNNLDEALTQTDHKSMVYNVDSYKENYANENVEDFVVSTVLTKKDEDIASLTINGEIDDGKALELLDMLSILFETISSN